jgi:TonB family protein|tara:strand:+ start:454 stop:1116 length:663 start_codon:yes stop_codon:yes gene_type:complete
MGSDGRAPQNKELELTALLSIMLAATLVPAMPAKSPGYWLSDDDYPSGALKRKEEGPVAFSLLISPTGRIANCMITQTSGSADLDERTCAMIASRGRFKAARDENAAATYGSYRGMLYWRLPGKLGGPSYRYVPPVDMTLQVKRLPGGAQEERVTLTAKFDQTGHVTACQAFNPDQSSAKLVEVACQQTQQFFSSVTADADGRPVPIVQQLTVKFQVAAP